MGTLSRTIILCLLPGAVFGQQASLKEAAQKAVNNNPEVQAKWHAFRAADEEQDVAFGGYLPKVDVSAGTGRERKTTPGTGEQRFSRGGTTVTLNQMLYDGFATRNEVRRLGHARATRYFELLDASETAALEAARAYYDVLRYRRLGKLAEDNYVQHRSVLEQIQRRVQAGVGRRVDLEQAAGRLALAEANLLTETANLHDVSARYQRIVGERPAIDLPAPGPVGRDLPAEAAAALKTALERNPVLLAAIENVRAAQAEADVRRAAYQPRLDFRLREGRDRNLDGLIGQHEDRVAEVVLSFNVFNGGSDLARSRQYAERRDLARDLRDKACRDTRQTVAIAYNDTRKLTEQLRYLDQHQLSIEKARDAYRKQFDIGQRTLLDLLDSENELFQARRAYANADYDLAIAYVRAQAGMGNVLAALGLARRDVGDLPELKDWSAGEDAAENCPPEVPLPATVDKDALNARAMAALPAGDSAVAAPARPQRDAEAALQQAVNSWAAAWAGKNFETYAAFYASAFVPAEGVSREQWTKQRKARVTKPGVISISIEDIRVVVKDAEHASTEFRQSYRSDGFRDEALKTLEWLKVEGRWLIVKETAAPMNRP